MPTPAASRLDTELNRLWRRYQREIRRLARDGPTEPAVHDCRVAGRRLMIVLRLAERVAPGCGARGLRRRVRHSFQGLARLRDVQVEQALASQRAAEHPVLRRLVRRLRREEARLQSAAGAALEARELRDQQRRFTALLGRWKRPRATPGGRTPGPTALRAELRRELYTHAKALAEYNAAATTGDPHTLHQVRVALKKFRYVLEAARGLNSNGLAAPLARARRWQARLGHLQDLRVLRDDARAYAAAHPDPAWEGALAALDTELAAGTRAYVQVRSRLTALVSPYLDKDDGPTHPGAHRVRGPTVAPANTRLTLGH